MKPIIAAGAAGLVAISCAGSPAWAQGVPGYIAAALGDPHRPADQVARDAARRPDAILAFTGVKPGQHVADFVPGGGYFTRLFADAAGPGGRVWAIIPEQMARACAPSEFAGTHALEHDAAYPNVRVLVEPAEILATPERLDLVFSAQNYHDLHDHYFEGLDVGRINRAVFRALKPGGVYVVIDHVAEPGSGLRDTERLHRIDPEAIKRELRVAGFVFEAETPILRNPDDDHSLAVFDPTIRGHTDQVVFRFRKPTRVRTRSRTS
jgi:predicted methyltransferase